MDIFIATPESMYLPCCGGQNLENRIIFSRFSTIVGKSIHQLYAFVQVTQIFSQPLQKTIRHNTILLLSTFWELSSVTKM